MVGELPADRVVLVGQLLVVDRRANGEQRAIWRRLADRGPIRRDPCFFAELAPIYLHMILLGITSSLGTVLHPNCD